MKLMTTMLALIAVASAAQEEARDPYAELADPATEHWERLEREIFAEWERSGSDALDFLLLRANDAIEDGDYPAAVRHATALIDHAPDFAEGWAVRALAWYSQEEFGLALYDLRAAIALNPRQFVAIGGLGVILEQLGEDKAALDAYREAARLNPHREDVTEAIERLEPLVGDIDI